MIIMIPGTSFQTCGKDILRKWSFQTSGSSRNDPDPFIDPCPYVQTFWFLFRSIWLRQTTTRRCVWWVLSKFPINMPIIVPQDDFYFWNTETDETTWDIEVGVPRLDGDILAVACFTCFLGGCLTTVMDFMTWMFLWYTWIILLCVKCLPFGSFFSVKRHKWKICVGIYRIYQ